MLALSVADCCTALELAADALRHVSPEFPDLTVTESLRNVFQAESAGVAEIDFCGTASRPCVDPPHPIPADPCGFHNYAVGHPLPLAYRRTGELVPLRLSDVASRYASPPAYGRTGANRILAIPLAITPQHISSLALMRSGPDFTVRDVELARVLQPMLSGLYALRDRITGHAPISPCVDLGVRLTARELGVLDLMASGLIAAAIARQLGISPRTVSKHIENIYRKLGAHDRTSAVLRGQDLGIMQPGSVSSRSRCRAAPRRGQA